MVIPFNRQLLGKHANTVFQQRPPVLICLNGDLVYFKALLQQRGHASHQVNAAFSQLYKWLKSWLKT